MSTLRRKLGQAGYDPEEAYFYERERELIKNMKEKQAKESEAMAAKANVVDLLPRGQNSTVESTDKSKSKKVA